ncbi:MAG: IPT/TIG domain-containing protein [Syntrophomonadaceae bacterium]|jgi:hypothetical protein
MKVVLKYKLLLILLFIFLGIMPQGMSPAAATDTVTIRNIYEGFIRTSKVITIEDSRIGNYIDKKMDVNINEGFRNVGSLQLYGNNIVQAVLDKSWDISQVLLSGTIAGTGAPAQVQYKGINENDIPEITSIETPQVGVNEGIIVNGPNNLKTILDSSYSIQVGMVKATAEKIADNQIRLVPSGTSSFAQGVQDITITRTVTITDGANSYTLQNIFVYKRAVTIVGELDLTGITMFPTMGEPGSEIQFERANLQECDIYFIRDLNKTSLYIEANRAKNFDLVTDPVKNDVITVTVPEISPGPYYIVFTNPNSQSAGIIARYILPGQQYTVIEVSQQPKISNVEPTSTPSQTDTQVAINGYYLASLNLPGFDSTHTPELSIEKDPSTGIQIACIDYGTGTLTIGSSKYENVKVKRTYKVFIGQQLPFEDFVFDPKNESILNTIKVKTPSFYTEKAQVHPVIVLMETSISGGFNSTMVKEVVWADANGKPYYFTYLASSEKPEVSQVIPGIIPIQQQPAGTYCINSSINELQIVIKGNNFLVTRYTDTNGVEQINYPQVKIGGVVINNNQEKAAEDYKPLSFEVLKGDITVDGTDNNQVGDTILIRIKTGPQGMPIRDRNNREVVITNPIRHSANFSAPFSFAEKVIFELINENDFPIIASVTPNLVPVQGGVNVLINGSNLRTGASVYIGGKQVTNLTISSDNKSIQFTAPAGREGETLLLLQNPGGGIATYPFTYTTTYTDPKIISVQPPKGTTGTMVTVTGDAFLPPDPTIVVDSIADIDQYLIYRLIGTRILMNGHDINEYNLVNNRIQLTPFADDPGRRDIEENIFVYRDYGQIELGKGFNGTILFDETNKKFYRISRNIKNQYAIEGRQIIGDSIQRTKYEIIYNQDTKSFGAVLNGKTYTVKQDVNGKLQLVDGNTTVLSLTAYTPYLIKKIGQYDQITGNRVFITDPLEGATGTSDKLVFEVPDLSQNPWTGNGFYDVTVINPDTKSVTKARAFEYFSRSVIVPLVTSVEPTQGPDSGGNIVKLVCPQDVPASYRDVIKDYQSIGFVDTAGQKTRVFIGAKEAAATDVVISPDGKQLSFRVPAYGESLNDDLTDRITMPIVLLNPDGGTFSITYNQPLVTGNQVVYGYTYIKPTSNPRIVSISPQQGPAKGGYIVEIFGTDFRDFVQNGDETEKADLNQKAVSQYDPQYEYLTSPLLPSIYFGAGQAELLEYSPGYLQVLIPPGSGAVDVYVVNNDAGISNAVRFNYQLSTPKINSISPPTGRKQGGYKVEITGSGFDKNTVNLLSDENLITEKPMPTVKVGNITNSQLPRDNANAGVIVSSRATVTLAGGLTVRYNAVASELTISINDFDQEYSHTYNWDGNKVVFINTSDLQTSGGEIYPYKQLLRMEIKENRLLVDTGYAPEVLWRNSGLLEVTMPGYYTVGTVPVIVINPDGGTATTTFEYKNPDSNPKITNIKRDSQEPEEKIIDNQTVRVLRINCKAKSIISILGEDFRENARIQISTLLTISPKDITYTLPDKLTFTMPVVDESQIGKLHRVLVINEDGGLASSDQLTPPLYIQFTRGETAPQITGITPNRGPVDGGTVVQIMGNDFRAQVEGYKKALQVYWGENQADAARVKVINYKTVQAVSPAHTAGVTKVRVENPDGEITTSDITFTYISHPQVAEVVNPVDGSVITAISALGGQEIKIKGSGFMAGARVIFNPVTQLAGEDSNDVIFRVGEQQVDGLTSKVLEPYTLVSGVDGTEVKVLDAETIIVKTPAGKLDTSGIIIVNEDRGASDLFGGITYDLPDIAPPGAVVAEIVEDRYNNTDRLIKINWTAISGATEYEVYVVVDGEQEYIGSTALTTFVYDNLRPNTRYKFIVKTIGSFGASRPSAESNTVRTGSKVGAPDTDGGLDEKTQISRQGSSAVITIGTADFKKNDMVFDLTRGSLAGCKELVISIPGKVIAGRSQDINIYGPDYNLQFNPRVFQTATVIANQNKSDAGVRFTISPYSGSINLTGGNHLSTVYDLEARAFVGQSQSRIDYLTESMVWRLDFDTAKASLRRLENVTLNRFSDSANNWQAVAYGDASSSSIEGMINRLGRYVILGSRR